MVNLLITLLIIAVCFYTGIIYVNTSILTVGYALLILLSGSALELIYRFFSGKCFLEIPVSMVEKEEPLEINIKFLKRSLFGAGKMKVQVQIQNALQSRGKRRWITLSGEVDAQRSRNFSVVMKDAGFYTVRLKKIRIYSLTGMVYIHKRCAGEGSFLILPEIRAMGVMVSDGTRNLRSNPDVPDDFRSGSELSEGFEIREYRPKDKLHNIHWKLSAKADDLMVKEIFQPQPCSIVIMLDARKAGERNACIHEFLTLAASISYSIMDQKCPHFVTWISRDSKDVKRIRVDDDESFYLFLNYALQDIDGRTEKDIRQEYRNKYRNEYYVHDVQITTKAEVYKNGEFVVKWNNKDPEGKREKMELLL